MDKGFIVRPVVPPTVPAGEERVRVCLRAGMDREVIRRLIRGVEEWTKVKINEEREGGSQGAVGGQVTMKAKL